MKNEQVIPYVSKHMKIAPARPKNVENELISISYSSQENATNLLPLNQPLDWSHQPRGTVEDIAESTLQ